MAKSLSSMKIASILDVVSGNVVKDAEFAVLNDGPHAGQYLPVDAEARAAFLAIHHAREMLMRECRRP